MRIKTSELTGAPLNWAVATAMGLDIEIKYGVVHTYDDEVFMPDLDWNIVGFIITREGIDVHRVNAEMWSAKWWANNSGMVKKPAQRFKHNIQTDGPNPRIAALRCYVASKMGDEVEIPEGLLT
jgi:hypothetical protein